MFFDGSRPQCQIWRLGHITPVRETVFQQHRSAGDENSLDNNEQGRRAAYASQFLDPIGRAWRTKAKVKAALLGDEDPDEWDLPPKPKGMRRATYERWVAKYDAAADEVAVAGKYVWLTSAREASPQSLGRTGVIQTLTVT